MLEKSTPVFKRLLHGIERMPVIDCHEHLAGPGRDLALVVEEPIAALITGYLTSDLWAAGASGEEIALLQDEEATTDDKWPVFARLWAASEHTAYARVTKLMLRDVYGIEELTRDSLEDIRAILADRNASDYLAIIHDQGIKAIVADVLFPFQPEVHIRYFANPVLQDFLEGQFHMPEAWHPVFPLPYFHEIRRREFINYVEAISGLSITSLQEYEQAVFELIQRSKKFGVVALKDQSAYRRLILYDLPPRSDAERCFNKLLTDPRQQLAWPEAKPLDDYLFHQYMRFARDLDLPVQIHTGHMAGIRNRVDKANAVHLASVLELHADVMFDLFHGNWPYMGDLLFLGKNYPNVSIDLCWVHMIDPAYAQALLKRAVMTLPHTKIHCFGGDYKVFPELAVAHLAIARQVTAGALADLVECGWFEEEVALRIAADWLFNNPNQFYRLQLSPYKITGS